MSFDFKIFHEILLLKINLIPTCSRNIQNISYKHINSIPSTVHRCYLKRISSSAIRLLSDCKQCTLFIYLFLRENFYRRPHIFYLWAVNKVDPSRLELKTLSFIYSNYLCWHVLTCTHAWEPPLCITPYKCHL